MNLLEKFFFFTLSLLTIPQIAFAQIVLNEIFPNPPGKESATNPEFVEIFNPTKQAIDIAGWSITDLAGHSFAKISTSRQINPAEFLVFYNHRILNNTGSETVFLKNAQGKIVDQISYTNAIEGQAYARINSASWQWQEPSPTKANIKSDSTQNLDDTASTKSTFNNSTSSFSSSTSSSLIQNQTSLNQILTQTSTPTNLKTIPTPSPPYTQAINKNKISKVSEVAQENNFSPLQSPNRQILAEVSAPQNTPFNLTILIATIVAFASTIFYAKFLKKS